MGFEQEFVEKRLFYYGIPHYLFLLIYLAVICKFHASASQNLQTSKPCTFRAKCFFNLLCIAISIFLAIYESLLHLLFAIAWACSLHLLYFQYDRALPLSWPHRFYWMVDFFFVLVVFAIELIQYYDNHSTKQPPIVGEPTFLAIMSLLLVSLLSLTLIAFFYPKDFHSTYQAPPIGSGSVVFPQEPFIASEDITARIFKQSVTAGEPTVLFHIRIFSRGHPSKKAIKRSLPDFQALDETLRFKYADSIRQGELFLPEIPASQPQSFSQLSQIESSLNHYLSQILSSDNMLTRQVLQFLGFTESVVSRTLIHFNEKTNGPILRPSDTTVRQLDLRGSHEPSPFQGASVSTAPTASDLRHLLRMIWEREEIILVEVSNGTLESSQHRIVYPLRLSFAPSLSIRYSTAFQTEVSLLDMQKLDKYLRTNRPELSFLPLPEQDLIYASPGVSTFSQASHRSQIDMRFVYRSKEQIEHYLLFAFNDPAYYCNALFDLVQKFQALSLLRSLESLFDGKLAIRQNGRLLMIQAEEMELSMTKHTVTSVSYKEKGEKKLRVTEIEISRRDMYKQLQDSRASSTSIRHQSELVLGRYNPRGVAAGTGQISDEVDGQESKEENQSRSVEMPEKWWSDKLETDFIKFSGLSFQANLQNSEVKLTRDRSFQILFTLKIERYEAPFHAPKNTWVIYRSNNQFIELDRFLSRRFEHEYQELFERGRDYLSELKVHWEQVSESVHAQRLLRRYLCDLVQLNGLFNCLAVRRFFAMEEGFPRLEQEGRSQTLDDYFDMQSIATSELESHHESLFHSPEQAIITPDYFH